MTNQEIIDNIKSKLTKDKEVDLPYLRCEFQVYRSMKNDEVMYAILQLIFKYLSKDTKEELDTQTHDVLAERSKLYEEAVIHINNNEDEQALKILQSLVSVYEKLENAKVQNYFDFEQMIEYIMYCGTVEQAKKLNVKRYPEPVTYYTYQIACIYIKQNKIEEAIKTLEQALKYNPRSIYITMQLVELYISKERHEEAFTKIKEALTYSYSKDQFAFFYEKLADYYTLKEKYNIAIASYLVSDNYYGTPKNKEKVGKIVEKAGYIKFNTIDDIINLFKEENINYGPSKELIETVDEFIKYSKKLKDLDSVKYLLSIMIDLTDDEYYKELMSKLV